MITIENKSLCSGCSACANVCPKSCIEMIADDRGFLYPSVDESKCIQCGLCNKVCPFQNPQECKEDKKSYAAYFDNDIRDFSSSGGMFGCFAKEILSENGVIFGATFTDDFKSVKHIGIENLANLPSLYGSKYLQSVIGDTYKSVEQHLKADRPVLFVGTSCQISGLKAYLRKDYDRLLTVDVICHGTPSPIIWKDYATKIEQQKGSNITDAYFRNKRFGWSKSVLLLLFADGSEYCELGSRDAYMRGFLSNIHLRESCYQCKCKGSHVLSDISLGDFWGIEKVLPDFSDDKGVSAVILNTEKGKQFFEKVKPQLTTQEVTYDDIVAGNPSLINSVQKPKNSEKFWQLYSKYGLTKAYKVCFNDNLIGKCYRLVRRLCGKIIRIIKSTIHNIKNKTNKNKQETDK